MRLKTKPLVQSYDTSEVEWENVRHCRRLYFEREPGVSLAPIYAELDAAKRTRQPAGSVDTAARAESLWAAGDKSSERQHGQGQPSTSSAHQDRPTEGRSGDRWQERNTYK